MLSGFNNSLKKNGNNSNSSSSDLNGNVMNNNNNNNKNNNNGFSLNMSKASLSDPGLGNSNGRAAALMSMENDFNDGFDSNVKFSSSYKSSNKNQSSLSAFRSVSDPYGNAYTSNNNNSYDDADDYINDSNFRQSGGNYRGVATAMQMPSATSFGFSDSPYDMNDADLDAMGPGMSLLSMSAGLLTEVAPKISNKTSVLSMPPQPQAKKYTSEPVIGSNNNNDFDDLDNIPAFGSLSSFVPPPAQAPPAKMGSFSEEMNFLPPPSKVMSSDVSSDDSGFLSPRKDDGCFVKPSFYNEYTTCTMENSPKEVLNGVSDICSAFGDEKEDDREMEFEINAKDYLIEGIAYIKHKPLKFMISIWHDSEKSNDLTRVEFQKRRGDSMLFQQFWCEMLESIHKAFKNVSGAQRCRDFESFFMPSFDLEDDYMFTGNDLNNMAADLENDYRDESLEVLATLCEEMGKSQFCQLVSKHEALISTLVKKTLGHFDSCHVRGGLCALSKMVESGVPCMKHLIEQTPIMCQLVALLSNPSKLIQKRAVQLMSQLSASGSEWNLEAKQCDLVENELKSMDNDANASMKEMFKNIREKVDSDRSKQSKQ